MNAKACVLVVDDEPENRDLLRRTLRRSYDVVEAEDSDEALATMSARGVELVICDQQMPGRTGTELAAVLRERWPKVPIVLMTGFEDENVDRAGDTGLVAAVISKPCQPSELRKLVERLLAA